MNCVFFGSSKFVIPVIETLNKNFNLLLVVTTEKGKANAVPSYCNSKNIKFISISKFDKEIEKKIRDLKADVGVLGYFGIILSENILKIFPKGIINIHPSLLPLYRGATPVQSAILNGDLETGVTIIKLDEHMDHGPMLGQEKIIISENDTTESLHDRLFKKGSEMIEKVIPLYVSGKIKLKDQDESRVTYTKRSFKRADGYFELNTSVDKNHIKRMINAFYPWPAAWTEMWINNNKTRVKFLPAKACCVQAKNTPFCLQVEGKNPMKVKDFLNGYPYLKEELKEIV